MAENDQNNENLNSQNQNGGAENQDDIKDDDVQEDLDALALADEDDAEALKEANRKLFARAKKAEGFVQDKEGNWVKKTPKPAPKPVENNSGGDGQNKPPAETIDPLEQAQLANAIRDLSPEEIQEAKDIAKGKGITVLKALETPAFKAFHAANVEADKKEKARLGASRGSGSHEDKPKFRSGMTREEHKEAWEETAGK